MGGDWARDGRSRPVVDWIVAELSDLEATGRRTAEEEGPRIQALAALLSLDERAVEEAVAVVRAGGASEDVRSLVACALGLAGTPKAQEALIELLEDTRLPDVLQLSLIVAASQVEAPSSELERCFEELPRTLSDPDLARSAVLVSGAISGKLGDPEGARSRAAAVRLVLGYEAATELADRVAWLKALGNAGLPSTLGTLARAVRDADPAIREGALSGLRRLETPEAVRAFEEILAKDPSAAVRRRAAGLLAGRSPDRAVPLLARTLLADEEESVRGAALVALGDHTGDPAAREAIAEAARSDASEAIREGARELLSR